MEHLIRTAARGCLALRDVAVDVGADSSSRVAGTVQEVGVIDIGLPDRGNANFHPTLRSAFYDTMPLRQVLQPFGQRLPAVEGLGNLRGVGARKLEKDMNADGKDGGTHLRRVLIEKLVGRDDGYAELACFGENGLDAALVGDEVLNFVAVESEERPFRTGEKRVLQSRENQASQGEGLFSESALLKIDNDPVALVHRFTD